MIDIKNIDLGKLQSQLRRYENQWVAISDDNKIVSHGQTYQDAVDKVKRADDVVLLKVPPFEYSLAPLMHEISVSEIYDR